MICIEDYDALGWFGGGMWDMAIFLNYAPVATIPSDAIRNKVDRVSRETFSILELTQQFFINI